MTHNNKDKAMKLIFKYVTDLGRELIVADVDSIENLGYAYVKPLEAGLWRVDLWQTLDDGDGEGYGPPTDVAHYVNRPTMIIPAASGMVGYMWRLDFVGEQRSMSILANHWEAGHKNAGLFVMNEQGDTVSQHGRNVNRAAMDLLVEASQRYHADESSDM